MTNSNKLSIIIVSYNTRNVIGECIESVIRTVPKDIPYEILIGDNASKDGSVEFIKQKYPRVVVYAFDHNYGFAKANNILLKKISGSYVLFLNPDTVVKPDAIQIVYDYLLNNKKSAVATGKVLLQSGPLDDACHRGFPSPWNAICHFSGLSRVFPKSKLFNGYHLGYQNMDTIHEIDSCSGAFMMVRSRIGESIGWFDEDFFWYGDDLDFCYRIKEKNWNVVYIPDATIIHYKGVASGIKKHSRHLSQATIVTKRLATEARFDVMKLFYRKHYRNVYPSFLMKIIFITVDVMKMITLKTLK